MTAYIHLADPHFEFTPGRVGNELWPFGRRLGPYDTKEEAVAQAVADLASGQTTEGALLGVFEEDQSEAARAGDDVRPAVAPARLAELAVRERAKRATADEARVQSTHPEIHDQWEALLAAVKDPALRATVEHLRARTA